MEMSCQHVMCPLQLPRLYYYFHLSSFVVVVLNVFFPQPVLSMRGSRRGHAQLHGGAVVGAARGRHLPALFAHGRKPLCCLRPPGRGKFTISSTALLALLPLIVLARTCVRCPRICGGCTGGWRCRAARAAAESAGTRGCRPRWASTGARPGGRATSSTSWSPGTTDWRTWPGSLPDFICTPSMRLLRTCISLNFISRTFELTSSLKKNDKDSLTWPHR